MTSPRRPRRRYGDWLEERALKHEVTLAKEVQRLWLLSESGAATAKERDQLERARKRLTAEQMRIRVIQGQNARRGVRRSHGTSPSST